MRTGPGQLQGGAVEDAAWRQLRALASEKRRRVSLVMRNFRCKEGEIDLIVEESPLGSSTQTLVFVEVRGRRSGQWVSALETVTFPKRRKIERAARRFLSRQTAEAPWESLRFDVMAYDGHDWLWMEDAWREWE